MANTPATSAKERARRRRTLDPVDSPQTLLQSRHGPSAGGQVILGRYRLLAKLGSGGFGVVWRAHDELLHRDVAVKRIWLGPDGDAERAAREAQATARLAHPAIVALYEACPQGEAFYLISELVLGETLAHLIAAGSLGDDQIVEIGLDLADALEHAHARGVIHRDIKPQNVLVPAAPTVRTAGGRLLAAKLTDFGGASIAEEDALTRTGDVLGTLAYMAPEQSEGREAAEEADLYSLALVLHEALTGENPVRGATPAATARRIGTRLPSLGRLRPDLPDDLLWALDDALLPDPRDRGTVEDLRGALQDALDAGPSAPRRSIVPSPRRLVRHRRRSEPAPGAEEERGQVPREDPPATAAPEPQAALPDHPGLPRTIWIALALAGAAWLAASGKPGVSVLLLAALLPLAAVPPEPYSRRLSPLWLGALLAPALGVAGLAGAFPALAGQARRRRLRLVLGALGYWWTVLAEPLLGRRLWLGSPPHTPPPSTWEGSVASAASHVVAPLLSTGVLFGALLWGVGALVLPWIVRGAHAALDVLAATIWSAAIFAAAPGLAAGLGAAGAHHPSPRGAVLGAVLGGLVAIAARALRGPV